MKKVWEHGSHAFPPHYTPGYTASVLQALKICNARMLAGSLYVSSAKLKMLIF